MDTRSLALAGELLIGEEWQRPLARLLGPMHPLGPRPTMDPRLVQRWANGERSIPGWVAPLLSGLLRERVEFFENQAREADRLSMELAIE